MSWWRLRLSSPVGRYLSTHSILWADLWRGREKTVKDETRNAFFCFAFFVLRTPTADAGCIAATASNPATRRHVVVVFCVCFSRSSRAQGKSLFSNCPRSVFVPSRAHAFPLVVSVTMHRCRWCKRRLRCHFCAHSILSRPNGALRHIVRREQFSATPAPETPASPKVQAIMDNIMQLTLLDTLELVKALKTKLGYSGR